MSCDALLASGGVAGANAAENGAQLRRMRGKVVVEWRKAKRRLLPGSWCP